MSLLTWIFGKQPPEAIEAADRLLEAQRVIAPRRTCIVDDDVVHARTEQAIALSLKLAQVPGNVWPASIRRRGLIASYFQYTQVRLGDEIARQRGGAQ